MIAHIQIVSHKPPEKYGDCLRASVASVLNVENVEDVPHFAHDGAGSEKVIERLRSYLYTHHTCLPFLTQFDGSMPLSDLLEYLSEAARDVHYLLFCRNSRNGDHVVIGCGGTLVHDVAWLKSFDVSPARGNVWTVCVMVKA